MDGPRLASETRAGDHYEGTRFHKLMGFNADAAAVG